MLARNISIPEIQTGAATAYRLNNEMTLFDAKPFGRDHKVDILFFYFLQFKDK